MDGNCPTEIAGAACRSRLTQDLEKVSLLMYIFGEDASIQAAIVELQHIYQSTIFPYMKVDWRTHPNNIGHFYTPGCFRCHDGAARQLRWEGDSKGLQYLPHCSG
jgi:hypothetical protein